MNTHKKTTVKPVRFLALVPHRDSRNIIEDYRSKLFSAGFMGAYSFPVAAPLALLSRPFNKEELKTIAQKIREESLINEGKIIAGESDLVRLPGNGAFDGAAFFGPVLSVSFPEILDGLAKKKVLFTFPKAVLCAALLSDEQQSVVLELEPFSFRAAMVCNLVIRPLKSGEQPYSFEWRLGPGCWLPGKQPFPQCFSQRR